ncbi:hypothetical protein [Methylobacterium dankookense]|uniref:WGR domain-containing protein n=1 Tax=Methylobacterium dankookense TaxID=560405 RepID=A0A564G540_9HYPH|nr:hypothetical protein [Methylobacterium dankookense]GJD59795.1 hypothetical protein IFDJLNFL_5726 [Methylobacterium dankookense]VUF15154.1 hypothetical protein MTDSW087_04889 [Methylobacterium dankookense]
MKVVRSARLHLREGSSDKVYEVDLVENDAVAASERFLVNVRYGRRGAALREGSKTPRPVAGDAATKVFDSVVVSKLNGGYRHADRPEPGGAARAAEGLAEGLAGPEGREAVLLARLAECRRGRWPDRERERLLWRIGQLRLASAAPDLLALAQAIGPAEASYALVWALARAAGAEAAAALEAVAAATRSTVIRDLARFALVSPLMGAHRHVAVEEPDLPGMVDRPARAGDPDGLVGALTALAEHDPGRLGPALVALGRRAQAEAGLHAALCAALPRLPARPPYLIGLRRLFKQAEMADDAGLFGATARRIETATAMYRAGRSHAYLPELGHSVALRGERGRPDARIGLSTATLRYLKRRIWRALRKRGEAGDPAFAEMAAGFLLGLHPKDLTQRVAWTVWARRPDGSWGPQPRARGPLAANWTASQLLYRNAAQARPRPGSLTFLEEAEIDPESRGEAFPELWRARPDLALRLAAEGRIEPVAMLGLRLLRADPAARDALTPAGLERLLAAAFPAVQGLALEIARERLARGEAGPELLAALVGAPLPEARALALRRIEAEAALPWSSPPLAFALLTSPAPEVGEALVRLAGARALPPEAAAALAGRLVDWLRAMPPVLDETARARIRAMRAGLPLLWPAHGLPVAGADVAALMAHAAAEVAAAGIALLARSDLDAEGLPAERWEALTGSDSEEVREAALGLLARLGDARLKLHADRILAFASGPSSPLRRAARPLVRRLAEADPDLAPRLARELIGSLFHAAPDEAYAADVIDLLREALPGELAALDAGTLWRLLQARAKGAQRLGAALLDERPAATFSVRQIARLGDHPHLSVRRWAMAAYAAEPARFQAEAADAVLLVESGWPETLAFARSQFEAWPEAAWSPAVLAVVTDSVRPEVLAFARHLLRSRLRPGDAEAQLLRLLEHPSPAMHLLVTELLTEEAVASEEAFAKLIPLARIVMLQVLKGRIAKDRMAAFLRAEALRSRARAESLLPLFADLSLSGTARDRTAAILALRDIAEAHPGLGTPLARHRPEARPGAGSVSEAAR